MPATAQCRQMESEMIGDGRGCADKAYHDNGVLHCCCHLGVGSIELSPLVVKDRGLVLPLSPSPGHWMQSVDGIPNASAHGAEGVMGCSMGRPGT